MIYLYVAHETVRKSFYQRERERGGGPDKQCVFILMNLIAYHKKYPEGLDPCRLWIKTIRRVQKS